MGVTNHCLPSVYLIVVTILSVILYLEGKQPTLGRAFKTFTPHLVKETGSLEPKPLGPFQTLFGRLEARYAAGMHTHL